MPKPRKHLPPKKTDALRKRAEALLKKQTGLLEDLSASDMRTLIHELGTHQIELEMQNEELRRAQEELEASRLRYADLYDFAPIGYVTLDGQGMILDANLTIAQLIGKTRRSLLNKPFKDFVSADDWKAFREHRATSVESGRLRTLEISLRRADGSHLPVQLESIATEDGEGKTVTVRTAISDITERKQAEKRLAYLASFPQLNPNPVLETDMAGDVTFANQATMDTLERLGRNRSDTRAFVPDDLNGIIASWDRRSPLTANREVKIAEGIFNVTVSLTTDLNTARLYAYDITERKQAETAMKRSEEKYRSLFNNMIDGFALHEIVLDTAGKPIDYIFLAANSAFERLTGMKAAYIVGKRVTQVLPGVERDPADWIGTYGRVALTGSEARFERYAEPLGKWFAVTAYSMRRGTFATIFEDITDRKRAENELRRASEEQDAIFRATPYLLSLHAKDGRWLKVNPAVIDLFGIDPTKAGREEVAKKLRARFLDGTPVTPENMPSTRALRGEIVRGTEYMITDMQGRDHIVQLNAIPLVRDGEVHGMVLAQTDITELRQIQDELKLMNEDLGKRVTERTAELRNLQAHVEAVREAERTGIAREIHDELGQVLTAIKMDVSWLSKRLPREQSSLVDKAEDTLAIIDVAIQSVKRISAELRPGMLDDIGLSAAIDWACKEFGNRAGFPCTVTISPENLTIDRMRSTALFRILQEALTNIMRHARCTQASVSLVQRDRAIILTVKDNGKGIRPEEVSSPHAFGLIGMRERVQFLHGRITFEGSPDSGTTVTVTLPIDSARE